MRMYENVWEAGKARCAGRHAAPASHTLGIARRPRTMLLCRAATLPYSPILSHTLSYSPILSHTLSYSPIKQPPSIPLPAYAANNKKNGEGRNQRRNLVYSRKQAYFTKVINFAMLGSSSIA